MAYPQCVVCHVNLDNPEYHVFICPECHRRYILDYEVLSFREDVGTVYDDDTNIEIAGLGAGGPGLSTSSDKEFDFKTLEEEEEAEQRYNKDRIKIPHYMKDGQTTTVEDFHEE